MARDNTVRILWVAFCVSLVCSVLVSVAAIGLKEQQELNKASEKKRNILQIARIYDPSRPVEEQFDKVKVRSVDLENGQFVAASEMSGEKQAPYLIPTTKDKAGIKTRPRFMEVYTVEEQGRLSQIILPVYGKGLWSTMYGFIALGADFTTITGFGFYEHGETPGLGGEIDNPVWRGKWPGKEVYDQNGALRIEVIKGEVDPQAPDARYKVDGLSGATLTARGVGSLLAYWLGENGYQPFLQTLKKSGGELP